MIILDALFYLNWRYKSQIWEQQAALCYTTTISLCACYGWWFSYWPSHSTTSTINFVLSFLFHTVSCIMCFSLWLMAGLMTRLFRYHLSPAADAWEYSPAGELVVHLFVQKFHVYGSYTSFYSFTKISFSSFAFLPLHSLCQYLSPSPGYWPPYSSLVVRGVCSTALLYSLWVHFCALGLFS